MKKIYKDLAEVRSQKEAIIKQENDLVAKIIKDMNTNDLTSVPSELGNFVLATRTTYTYPDKVTDKITTLKEDIQILQYNAQQEGKAKKIETQSFRFTPKKEK